MIINTNDISNLTSNVNNGISDSELKILLVDTWSNFSNLEADWNRLAETSAAHIYQTHTWLSTWWKYYNDQKNDSLFILIFYHRDNIVGIAPFYLQTDSVFGIKFYRRLCLLASGNAFNKSFGIFLDDGPSDYLDIIVKPGYEKSVPDTLSDFLIENSSKFDEINLLNIREDSKINNHLLPALQHKGFEYQISFADVCPYMTTPSSVEKFLNERHQSVKRRLVQSWKAAKEGSIFSIRMVSTTDDYQESISRLIQLHQSRWNKIGYPGFFASNQYRLFFSDIIMQFNRNGWLWFKTAHDGEHCIAGRLAFRFNDRLYDYLTGFDESTPAAKRRPGLALLIEMIDDAVREKIAVIDLLRGNEAYKFEFTNTLIHNSNIRLRLPSQGKAISNYALQILKFISFIRFIFNKEIELFKIQNKNHAFPLSFFYYFRFRSPMLLKKVKNRFLKINKTNNYIDKSE